MNNPLSDHRAKRNMAFNFAGRLGSSLLMFVFIPVLVSTLGAEAWGVVAFSISLAAISIAFDFGFGATLNRELAMRMLDPVAQEERGDVVITLELPFLLLAAMVCVILIALSEWLAASWLQSQQLPNSVVAAALKLAAPVVALQLLIGLYTGGLQGLQRQALTNAARLSYTLALYGGGCLILLSVKNSNVVSYFQWQLVCASVYTLALRHSLYRPLRLESRRPRWEPSILRRCYRFALGMAGTGILVVCLTQMDKLLLSRLLELEIFGFYMLAVSLTSLQLIMVQPVQLALFPQLTGLMNEGDSGSAGIKFLHWSRLVAVAIFPVGALLVFFAEPIALFWLRDSDIASQIAIPIAILAAGSVLNALCTLPYTLQLAAGWSSLGLYANLVSLLVMIPALLVLAPRYGQSGAAAVWLLLNLGYIVVQVPIMFRHLLPETRASWFRSAFFQPAAISFSVVGLSRFASGKFEFVLLPTLMMAGFSCLVAALLCWRITLLPRPETQG
jgi:O-antigen/teichoic acid export membrane protein